MIESKIKIVILTSKISWLYPYIKDFVKNNDIKKVIFKIRYNENKIDKGDVCFILGYYQKVKKETLEKFNACLVIHESDLPKGRGWSPISWQIEKGTNKIPICLIKAGEKIDAGEIYIKEFIELDGTELLEEIKTKQWNKTKEIIKKFINGYPSILKKGLKQKGNPTYYKKRTYKDNKLNPNKTIAEQFNKLRVCDNEKFPAWFFYKGKKYIIKIYGGGNR